VEALSMSNLIAVMDQGRIVQEGTPRAVYHAPVNEFVAGFIGSTNLIRGTVTDSTSESARLNSSIGPVDYPTAERHEPGSTRTLVIRPEDVVVHAEHPVGRAYVLTGEVFLWHVFGDAVEYQLSVADQTIHAKGPSRLRLKSGDKVFVELPVAACAALA
jgi:iron(III) transport system ATP-binding protein